MLDVIKNYWKQLEPRERIVLAGGGVVVALILFYALLWQPWQTSISSMKESVQDMRRDLVWVRQHGEILSNGGQNSSEKIYQGRNQSLLSIIESSAKKQKIRNTIQQMVPSNNDSLVRVVLEDVSFNSWLKWIEKLNSSFGINVIDVDVERSSDKPDIVEIRMTFERLSN